VIIHINAPFQVLGGGGNYFQYDVTFAAGLIVVNKLTLNGYDVNNYLLTTSGML
jgi:hypothetical protein